MPDVESPVVLITGVSGPVGRAAAQRFARDGARVALVGRDRASLDEIGGTLDAASDRWLAVPGELTDAQTARTIAATVTDRWGRIDVLLHLVGGYAGGTAVVDLDHDEIRGLLDQHLWTTLHIVQAVVPGMMERGHGRVVAISSPFATEPRAKGAGYAMAKAAEEVLVRSLAHEVAGSGVTANVVIVRAVDAKHERASAPSLKNASWATPEEIVDTLAFLASPAASAINGARIPLDGRG